MNRSLSVSYPGLKGHSGPGTMQLNPSIGPTHIHHVSLDINVMNDGAAPESTPVICSCGHSLVTLGALSKAWARSEPDGVWNMPAKPFVCACGTRYTIRGFDYEA